MGSTIIFINAKLTADINGITVMAGTASKPYTGTFDGQGAQTYYKLRNKGR